MKYRCIAFDIDGTLLDSASADATGLQVALRQELGRVEPYNALLSTFGMPGREILAALDVAPVNIERVMRVWQAEKRARAGWMCIFPGIETTLDGLRARRDARHRHLQAPGDLRAGLFALWAGRVFRHPHYLRRHRPAQAAPGAAA